MAPTDRELSVRRWIDQVPHLHEAVDALDATDFRAETVRALVLPGRPESSPQPVLVAVPYEGVREASQIVAPLTEALHEAATAARARADMRRATARRGLPLVALPLFGSAGGGGDRLRGEIIRTVLRVAGTVACAEQVDVALVLRDAADLAQAHAFQRSEPRSWAELDDDLVAEARRLAGEACNGRLVPFTGAGVSATAGLPLWHDLVQQLAGDLPEVDRDEFGHLGVLDQARVLRDMAGTGFNSQVATLTRAERYGLAPALHAGPGPRGPCPRWPRRCC